MTFLEALKIIGGIALIFLGFIVLNIIAYIQVAWGMTPEEKKDFNKYIQENGIYGGGGDDDHWPFY